MTRTSAKFFSVAAAPVLAAGAMLHQPSAPEVSVDTAMGNGTIVETALAAGRFNTLAAALTAANLVDTLNGPGPFTVFAPTDAAFAKIPADRLARLLLPENVDDLTSILTYHVLAGAVDATQVLASDFVTTLNEQRAYIDVSGAKPEIEGAVIQATDIVCSNGIIHVIDAVIIPELRTIPFIAQQNGNFDTLFTALEAADLVDTLKGPGPFTVFAPTDAAFDALPPGALDGLLNDIPALTDVLTYHVTAGRLFADDVLSQTTLPMLNGDDTDIMVNMNGAFIDDAQIVITDIQAENGVIHVIDAVLLP